MLWQQRLRHPGVVAALSAAVLFGAAAPIAKLLLQSVDPWLLAGLLYLGSGLGLWLYRRLIRASRVRLDRPGTLWFAGAVFAGGVVGPVLLMFGLQGMHAADASLLLTSEGAFTVLLAWFIFHENFDRRIALGMASIMAGAAILSWPDDLRFADEWPALAVLGACLAWGIDNNLTRKLSAADPVQIATIKGLAAGAINLAIAFGLGAALPDLGTIAAGAVVGLLGYGVSIALFVLALRHLGTARTAAYFSTAPFLGAVLALAFFDEPVTWQLVAAGLLMAVGVWLHLAERHEHEHVHDPLEHEHRHVHDAHHRHEHVAGDPPGEPHTHRHRHGRLVHAHPHYPDLHHRHSH